MNVSDLLKRIDKAPPEFGAIMLCENDVRDVCRILREVGTSEALSAADYLLAERVLYINGVYLIARSVRAFDLRRALGVPNVTSSLRQAQIQVLQEIHNLKQIISPGFPAPAAGCWLRCWIKERIEKLEKSS